MTDKQLNVQSEQTVFNGFFKVKLLNFSHSLYRGGITSNLKREIFCRGPAVVVLLYDTSLRQVVLVEQCRAGAIQNAMTSGNINQAWLLEPVAGMIDIGETPIQAAIRETKEETGLDVFDLEYISQFYPSPGACDEILHLFAGQVDSSAVDSYAGIAEEGEDIRIVTLSFSSAKQKLLAGDFNVATTYMALQWLFNQKLNS
jgi:ADP-ribose pyrophosphatase